MINLNTFVAITVLFFALSLNPSVGQAEALSSPDEVLERVTGLREAGDLQKAERVLARALQESPEVAAYHFEMANLYALFHDHIRQRRDRQKAQSILGRLASRLEHAVMLDPVFLPARYNLGVTYKRLGRYEDARNVFRQVLDLARQEEHHGVQFNTLMQIGAIYEEQGFFQEAHDAYLRARESDYLNPAVREALDTLDRREEEYRQREVHAALKRRLARRPEHFDYSPHSHAAAQELGRRVAAHDTDSFAQAIPYLSMMLVEQLLNRQGDLQDNFEW